MSNFSDYDLRKFKIKDTKDIYAFIGATKQGLDQIEVLVKKLNMSNAAQAGVIKSLQRQKSRSSAEAVVVSDGDTTSIVEKVTPDSTAESLIEKIKAATEAPEEVEEEVEEEEVVGEQKDIVEIDGFQKKRLSNGQTRYYFNNRLTKGDEIPEAIRAELDKQLG